MQIGFVGINTMGIAIADSLIRADHSASVHDPLPGHARDAAPRRAARQRRGAASVLRWRISLRRRRVSARWWRPRCGHRTSDRTYRTAGQGTYRGTVPTACRTADCGTCTGANRGAAERTLSRIIGIAASREHQNDGERCNGTHYEMHASLLVCRTAEGQAPGQLRFVGSRLRGCLISRCSEMQRPAGPVSPIGEGRDVAFG